ncbi:hypothetical protein ABT300_39805 [Streptomyces sp. NPDC001027]|uniref:hypothetical protein n=1 Tax=Streptomyces sp. NPDC001027 TaxID=3154771 RepID=UPI003326439C
MGLDVAGVVVEAAADGSGPSAGTRVSNSEGQREAGRGVRRLGLLARLAETKLIDPQVTRTAAWEEAPDLLAALGRRELTGRTVVRVS